MVRIGIVGIGGFGWTLVQSIRSVAQEAGCRLVAAADGRMDRMPEKAADLEQAGVRLFVEATQMYEQMAGQCEAIYVATGIAQHEEPTVEALRRSYHVHVEKPAAATVQEVDRMIEAARTARRFCMVGYPSVHTAAIRLIKGRVVEGRLGRIDCLCCYAGWPRTRWYYRRNDWAGKLRVAGRWVLDGPSTNALTHQVNNMLFLAGARAGQYATPSAVRAEMYVAGPIESHDTAAIEIRTAEGPTCYFLGSHCSQERFGPVITIIGTDGRATWDMGRGAVLEYADGESETIDTTRSEARGGIVTDFVNAIRSGDESLLGCSIRQGRNAVLAQNGAYESSRRVHRIGPKFIRRLDEDTDDARTVVVGLDELLVRAAERRRLFSDSDAACEWAVASETFDLAGYRRFPVQFSQ